MAAIGATVRRWHDAFLADEDMRTKGWPFMSSPLVLPGILLPYLLFVKVYGPRWMKNRKAFHLNFLVFVYDVLMVILSFIGAWIGSRAYYYGSLNILCSTTDRNTTDQYVLAIVHLSWWCLVLKMIEFLDTIFFVLRKKFRQISHLHVFHHMTVVELGWLEVKFAPGGQAAFFPIINSWVHVVMYSYYAITAAGYKVPLFWKKALTVFQMGQFVIGAIHASIPVFYDCGFPQWLSYVIIAHGIAYLVLFSDFYNRSYLSKNRTRFEGDKSDNITNGFVDSKESAKTALKERHLNGIKRD